MGPKEKDGLALEGDITICEDQRYKQYIIYIIFNCKIKCYINIHY